MSRILASFALLMLLLTSSAGAQVRSDSTVAGVWRLENGLEVRTLHVPHAPGVSVTLAFRAGSGYDPPGREGLSELLAELQFMGAAGNIPERTREEMASLRPLGWECRPGTRLVRFTEIATQAQLPGVLQQVATRLAGVQVTDASVNAALVRVRRDAGLRLFGEPSDALYWRVGMLARGMSDDQILRHISLAGLSKLTAKDVEPLLRARFQPGNASLALAGDLSGVDVRALVAALFGKLPGGPAMPDTVHVVVQAAKRAMPWKDLASPAGVIAVESPALTDSLHPAFYLGMLVTGTAVITTWGRALPPLVSRFQYSLLDDPELVRFYPPMGPDAADPDLLSGALYSQLLVVGGQQADKNMLDGVRRSIAWLLGGPIPIEIRSRLKKDPGALATLSNGMATRALWMGDEFWTDYLRRFQTLKLGHNYYYEWLSDTKHQTTLLLTPGR